MLNLNIPQICWPFFGRIIIFFFYSFFAGICPEVAIAPMTPNMRMQRRRETAATSARRLQPPPSPTHQHRLPNPSGSALLKSQLMADDVIRLELNSQQETERIVLASVSPVRRWRSLSVGQLPIKITPVGRRRKSRSLDSSPVKRANNCRLPGIPR